MKQAIYIFLLLAVSTLLSCQNNPSDADIQQHINDLFKKDMAGAALNAVVDSGVATITGQCNSAGCTADIIKKVKGIQGVKEVKTNIVENP